MNPLSRPGAPICALTMRWPVIATIVPFIPLVALWWLVTAMEVFPRVFFPARRRSCSRSLR